MVSHTFKLNRTYYVTINGTIFWTKEEVIKKAFIFHSTHVFPPCNLIHTVMPPDMGLATQVSLKKINSMQRRKLHFSDYEGASLYSILAWIDVCTRHIIPLVHECVLVCDMCCICKENICGRPSLLIPPPCIHIPTSWVVYRHQTHGFPGVKQLRIGNFTADSPWRQTAAVNLLWLRLGCGVWVKGFTFKGTVQCCSFMKTHTICVLFSSFSKTSPTPTQWSSDLVWISLFK